MTQVVTMMVTLIMTLMITMMVLPDTECPLVPFPLIGGSADSDGTAGVMLTIITPVTPVTLTLILASQANHFIFTFIIVCSQSLHHSE